MGQKRNLPLILKTLKYLGVRPLANLGLYRLGLISGHYRRVTSRLAALPDISQVEPTWLLIPPDRKKLSNIIGDQKKAVLDHADKILQGIYPLFGGPEKIINLSPTPPLPDWTEYETGKAGREIEDIKFIWEGARFCWAVNLAQAYQLTEDDRYSEKFWQLFDTFLENNSPYNGPNWVSAQESAIRIITVCFAMSVFSSAPGFSETRKKRVLEFLIQNANRIPLTLPYSKAQNNNHLLLEGAGLYTAGMILKGYPNSHRWKIQGWHIFQTAVQDQITPVGEYCQHSMNYHRLMLQASLWVWAIAKKSGEFFPEKSLSRLASAACWFAEMIDPISGNAPNLGSNDGAWLFPLGSRNFSDQQPTAQAASRAFTGHPILTQGNYDELGTWFGISGNGFLAEKPDSGVQGGNIRVGDSTSWASLRAVRYTNRPFQSDQLHLDLWFRGLNILLDAGTFSYNAPPPWDNSLAGTVVHNTILVDGLDQMTYGGRFLWLDWAQAHILDKDQNHCIAVHDGYKRIGVIHQREVRRISQLEWLVKDSLTPDGKTPTHEFILQWLLPDSTYRWGNNLLEINIPSGTLRIEIKTNTSSEKDRYQLLRSGVLIEGRGSAPEICGWFSPTYGQKIPALSFRGLFTRLPPLEIITTFRFIPAPGR